MRILYIDIDSLRPDHLGCYGYKRATSTHIDRIAREGVRFENCYVSDSPCLPSRTALFSGRFGFKTGVVGHGGTAAQPRIEGYGRGFSDMYAQTSWMAALRRAGYRTAAVSSFGQRHAAWHWYAGFYDVHDPGENGDEIASAVTPLALDWLARHGDDDNWFLYVNYWDVNPHFRTPMDYGNPFAGLPGPDWVTQTYLDRAQDACGLRCAADLSGDGWGMTEDATTQRSYPREPTQLKTLTDVQQWIDGYDVAIHYVDSHVGQLVAKLEAMGIYEDMAIIISADHGVHLGEMYVWGGQDMADHWVNGVPLIVRWPGLEPCVNQALHYQFDMAATVIELAGGAVPYNWDGRSIAHSLRKGEDDGRDYLILSHAAMTAQRAVRFDNYICLRTYHDGYKLLDPVLLFNVRDDPHELRNLAPDHEGLVDRAMHLLSNWQMALLRANEGATDPLVTVLHEGGPFHVRGRLPAYLEHLRATGRAHLAERLRIRHPSEVDPIPYRISIYG